MAYALLILISVTLTAQVPPSKPQFEVATVRPARIDDPTLARGFREMRRDILTTGKVPMSSPDRIRLQDWSLLDLIAVAYNISPSLVYGPPWLSSRDFDIEAKIPLGTGQAELNTMLQALLKERFGLEVHSTSRIKKGYALTVDRAGLRLVPAAAPLDVQPLTQEEEQTKALQNLAASKHQSDGGGAFTYVTWPAVTLDELATHLERFTEAPIENETGIQGKYSVTLQVSQEQDGSESTIFDAVRKLGLRLEARRIATNILFVDKVLKTPTSN